MYNIDLYQVWESASGELFTVVSKSHNHFSILYESGEVTSYVSSDAFNRCKFLYQYSCIKDAVDAMYSSIDSSENTKYMLLWFDVMSNGVEFYDTQQDALDQLDKLQGLSTIIVKIENNKGKILTKE